MSAEPVSLEEVERAFRAVVAAPSSAGVFLGFVEESVAAVPRAALFLVRSGRVKGWTCAGYPSNASRRLDSTDLPSEVAWFCADDDSGEVSRPPERSGPDFGQGAFDEAVAFPLRVGGGIVAVLLAERSSGELPWEPRFVRLLALLAEQRLELDLVRRRGAVHAVPPTAPQAVPVEVHVERLVSLPVAQARDESSETSLILATEGAPSGGGGARLAEARRFARLVATDIRLYNEEAVLLGRRQRDLGSRLADQLKRGRESFLRRFADLGPRGLALLEEAYVEVLAAGDPQVLGA